MNETLAALPAYLELRQLVAELSMISHAPIQGYEFAPSEIGRGERNRTSNTRAPIPHLGAHRPKDGDTRTPTGRDGEFRPRAPKRPPVEGDAASEKAWAEYEEELRAWEACYHRRTPAYFARQLARCQTEHRLGRLRDEARETLEAWRRAPIPVGQPPEFGSPQWKRWVGESDLQVRDLVRMFSVSRQYIHQVRKAYRDAA